MNTHDWQQRLFSIFDKTRLAMNDTLESTITEDEKISSYNHSELQSRLAFLLMSAYRNQFSTLTELDFEFASGKVRSDLCIMPKRRANWLMDELIVHDVPITTVEILSPEQSLTGLIDRIYAKHFPAGVQSVWLVVPHVQTVSILLADGSQTNVATGAAVDPVTGVSLELAQIFEG